MSSDAPIRVVLFYGPFLRSAREFAVRLEAHPDIDLAALYCAAPGETRRHQLADLRRRRGWLGLALFAFEVGRVRYVADMHDPKVIAEVRELEPDLGLGYGGPILRPELFRIPEHGTLGIHHGRLPEFRGKKTTFWEIWEGEPTAGVTIQRIDEGIDTGEIVAQGAVKVGSRGYESVWQAVQRLGVDLYIDAVLAVRDGRATFRRPERRGGPLRSDPTPLELLRLPIRRLRRRLGGGRGETGG